MKVVEYKLTALIGDATFRQVKTSLTFIAPEMTGEQLKRYAKVYLKWFYSAEGLKADILDVEAHGTLGWITNGGK